MALACTSFSADQVPAHQAKQIADAAPAKARAVPTKPRRVLIWITPTDADGFDQLTTSMAKEAFKKYGTDKVAVEQVLQCRVSQALHTSFLHWVVGYRSLCIPFAEFGGMHSIPYAIAANRHWSLFPKILGGTFTGHPWNEEVGITVDEPGHPLVAAFGGKDFRLADEIYQYGDPYDRKGVRVLLCLDPQRTNMGVKWIDRQDNDFALAWVKSCCRGRVSYTSFGHRTELFWNSQILQFYLDAIQFATGDLEVPTAPRAARPVKRAPGPTPPEVRAAPHTKPKMVGIAHPTNPLFLRHLLAGIQFAIGD
jgi:hypothetical protein